MRDVARQYLLDYLHEEFRAYANVRIRLPRTLRDETDGVMVRTETREYFFPTDWVLERRMKTVEAEVRRIKEFLDR